MSFPNTFGLLKHGGFLPLSCSYLQAHDVFLMEKRLGSSTGEDEQRFRTVWVVDGDFSCSSPGQASHFGSKCFTIWSPWFSLDELLWQAGTLLKKKWRRKQEIIKRHPNANGLPLRLLEQALCLQPIFLLHWVVLAYHQHSSSFKTTLLKGASFFSYSSSKTIWSHLHYCGKCKFRIRGEATPAHPQLQTLWGLKELLI